MPKIYYAILLERAIPDVCVNALMDVVEFSAGKATRISLPYARTDHKRQAICEAFLGVTSDPNDCLVMLDNDHQHPHDVVWKLTRYPPELGVVAVLSYNRGNPHSPLFFNRDPENGELLFPMRFPMGGLLECSVVAPCAMAIRRWVLQKFLDDGVNPFWQYRYGDPKKKWWGEDMFFGETCERLGIAHYVDTTTISPHYTPDWIGPDDWDPVAYAKESGFEYKE